jgi:3-dehydroquinate dehydratase-2
VKIKEYAGALGLEVEIFHSNIEGEVINRLYAAHDGGIDAAIINPDGFTRGYPALVTAISRVKFPTIEVHISNPAGAARTPTCWAPARAACPDSASSATIWRCAG